MKKFKLIDTEPNIVCFIDLNRTNFLSPMKMREYLERNSDIYPIDEIENLSRYNFLTSQNEEVKKFALNFQSFYSGEPTIIEYMLRYLQSIENIEQRRNIAFELESILFCSEKTSMYKLVQNQKNGNIVSWDTWDTSDLPF